MNINQGRPTFLERHADCAIEIYNDKDCTNLYTLTTVGEAMHDNEWDEMLQEAVLLALLTPGEAILFGGGASKEFWVVFPG